MSDTLRETHERMAKRADEMAEASSLHADASPLGPALRHRAAAADWREIARILRSTPSGEGTRIEGTLMARHDIVGRVTDLTVRVEPAYEVFLWLNEQVTPRLTLVFHDGAPAPSDGWRPISEAPTDGTEVLVWNGVDRWLATHRWWEKPDAPADDPHWRAQYGRLNPQPTMYAPLPAAPSDTGVSE